MYLPVETERPVRDIGKIGLCFKLNVSFYVIYILCNFPRQMDRWQLKLGAFVLPAIWLESLPLACSSFLHPRNATRKFSFFILGVFWRFWTQSIFWTHLLFRGFWTQVTFWTQWPSGHSDLLDTSSLLDAMVFWTQVKYWTVIFCKWKLFRKFLVVILIRQVCQSLLNGSYFR